MARKQKTIHYIYKTTCLVTNRYYIGMHSTCNIDDGYMGSGRRLRASIRKYGKETFKVEILEFFETRELLVEAEIKAITPDMLTDKNCMNIKGGGEGGFISDEQQRHRSKCGNNALKHKMANDLEFYVLQCNKISEGVKIAYNNGVIEPHGGGWNKGLSLTEEHRKNISIKNKNKGIGGWVLGYYVKPLLEVPNLILLKEENEIYGPTWCARKYNTSRPTIARWLKI